MHNIGKERKYKTDTNLGQDMEALREDMGQDIGALQKKEKTCEKTCKHKVNTRTWL